MLHQLISQHQPCFMRDSYQSFYSSDVATQHPRRDVRSEWGVMNRLELTAFEKYQEENRDAETLPPDAPKPGKRSCLSRRFTLALVLTIILVGVIVAATMAAFLDKNRIEARFEIKDFIDICESIAGQDVPLFGACFDPNRFFHCFRGVATERSGSSLCLEFEAGNRCECSPGLIIEVKFLLQLCDPNFACPLLNLSQITSTPTASPTRQPTL